MAEEDGVGDLTCRFPFCGIRGVLGRVGAADRAEGAVLRCVVG